MSASFLTVVATVLQVGGPLLGAGVAQVDRGLDHGLRPGDVGAVYYVLQVGPAREPRRIDVGRAEVAGATAQRASLRVPPDLVVRPYYSVDFEVPRERFSSAAERLPPAREPSPPAPSVEPPLVKPPPVKPPSVKPPPAVPPPVPVEVPDARMPAVPTADVPGGTYAIGVDDDEASFYNQQPRFYVTLAPFRVDLRPVSLARFSPSRRDDIGLPATNVTFAEARAHCRRRGGRLPTEREWEAAVAGGYVHRGAVYEWTASWYLPYPGNSRPEKEYGRSARVLRGGAGSTDPRLRYFMVPGQRRSDVGFRCVLGEAERR